MCDQFILRRYRMLFSNPHAAVLARGQLSASDSDKALDLTRSHWFDGCFPDDDRFVSCLSVLGGGFCECDWLMRWRIGPKDI